MRNEIIKVLMERDGMTKTEAIAELKRVRETYDWAVDNPEDVLADEFGLEPDYIFDLLL